MVEDIFSGLLEGLAEFVIEVVFEGLGEILSGIADWFSGGGSQSGGGATAGPVEKYKSRPKDLNE